MKLYDAKHLTITCELLAQKNVIDILDKHNASGYTIYEVEGNGDKGMRGGGFKNDKNVKIEVILAEDKLQDIVEEVARTLFSNYAIILYVSDIKILRPEKFS
jgi:nitrogen regulatory protein PII